MKGVDFSVTDACGSQSPGAVDDGDIRGRVRRSSTGCRRTSRSAGQTGEMVITTLFLSSSALRLTGIEPAEGHARLPFLLAHASSPNYAVDFR